jgi:hypothetical protein
MPMKPHQGESQSDFLARCVPEMIGSGEDTRTSGCHLHADLAR